MKLSTFFCFFPLFVVQIVAGSQPTSALASSPDFRSQRTVTNLSGGALKTKPLPSVYPSGQDHGGYPSSTPLTARRAAFLPVEADIAPSQNKPSILGTLRASFGNKGDFSLKERLTKKGLAAFLTFTFLSNISSISCVSFAWYAFSAQTGMSPLVPGQWKPFLAVLAGSMAVDVSLKPIRLALSIAAAPLSDRAMSWLQSKCKGCKRVALGIVFAGIIGSAFGLLAAGVGLASSVSGVPVFAP